MTHLARLALFAIVAGCVSSTPTGTGTNTLEGGVRIPAAPAAPAGTGSRTVHVTLSDTNGKAPMALTVSPAAVPSGDVTFVVKNAGTIVHEAVVLQTDVPFDKLPVDHAGDPPVKVATGADKVSEDANIGETGDPDLEAGQTRTFTIKNMAVGSYVIVCNLAGHYAMGMRAAFMVVPPVSVVHVTLSDTNGKAPMGLVLSPATVPPGDVTFVVRNAGTIEHEAVVLHTDVPFDKLPVDHAGDPPAKVSSGGNKVSEDANIGETGDPNLEPGDTRTFTIKNMAVGKYVIVCNLAGHYAMGMRAALHVQGPHTTVQVTLGDHAGGAPMTLKVSPATVPSGDVTFVVRNAGTIEHEAVVLHTDVPFDKLPVDHAGDPPVKVSAGGNKVSEDANIGETGDPNLEPGDTRTFTITDMVVARYVIVCNLAGHYAMGMRAPFTVTGARATVQVTLTDTGGHGPMGLRLSPDNVPAGDITFVVHNAGTIEHEAVVLHTDVPFDKLPVDHAGDPPVKVSAGGNKVSEDANIGETGDPNLPPGDTRSFTVATMEAGSYVVVCNIAGHYAMGMRAQLTVS